jgi:hypothetical protein
MDNTNKKDIVINQTHINDVINSLASVTNNTISIITKLVQNKNIEIIKKGEKQFNKIVPILNSYTEIMSNVISSITKNMPEGKNLADALGRVETYNKQTDKTTVNFTVIDAVKEIQNFVDSTLSSVTKLAESNFGFKAMFKIKKNIKLMKIMMNSIMKDLISSFTEIANNSAIKDIIKIMVKQPDTELIEFSDKSAKDNEEEIKDIIQNTYKESGQLGLVDVFTQTFNLLNAVVAMNPPNFIRMKLKLKKLTKSLKLTFDELFNFLIIYTTDKNIEIIKKASVLIAGKDSGKDNEGHEGLLSIVLKINNLVKSL